MIKDRMIANGNQISSIVYSIHDELKERNACKTFAERTGMSKASISKMFIAEALRKEYEIHKEVSYNLIYKVKDIISSDVAGMLNDGMSELGIRACLTMQETEQDIEQETEQDIEQDTRSVIVTQIFDVLKSYDISNDDIKLLKMLIKGLR